MDIEPNNIGALLLGFMQSNQHEECEKLMDKLQALLSEELTETAIDTYIINIFDADKGVLFFINETSYLQNRPYRKARSNAFKVLFVLLNNFPSKIKRYVKTISLTCLSSACSLLASSDEKEQALKVLKLLIEKEIFSGAIDEVVQIYSKLYNCRMVEKGDKVEGKTAEVFGAIARVFPTAIYNPEELLQYFLNMLESEMRNARSQLAISGYLLLIRDVFVNFAPPAESVEIQRVYKCVKDMTDPVGVRKVANRDAVLLIQAHATLFADKLYDDRQWWHTMLLKYLRMGLDEKKVGIAALETFYREIAEKMKCDPKDVSEYLNFFTTTLMDSSKNNFEIRTAIFGIGIFAGAFRKHLPQYEFLKLFLDVVQKVEYNYVMNEPDPDILPFLPVYIQTLASLMAELDIISDGQLLRLQRVLVLLVKVFPKLSQLHHDIVIKIFTKALCEIVQCRKKSSSNFICVIVRQGVMWSCSCPYPVESDSESTEQKEKVSFKNYLPLWKGLLYNMHSRKCHLQSVLERETAVMFVDEFIKTLLYLIHKLNLELKPKQDALGFSDASAAYEVVQISDYEIYLNVADFYQKLLSEVDTALLKKWINMLIGQLISKSLKHPLISGFYKLLSSTLKVCDKLDYFIDHTLKEDIHACFQSLQSFIKDMLKKMKQFSGDLQIACLQVLLTAPCEIIGELLSLAVPAFLTLFSIGRSYFHLVKMGLDTLNRWKDKLPEDNINPFLEQVIPSLDSYLRSRSLQNIKTKVLTKTRKTKQVLNKVKVIVEVEPQLFKLQKAILTFVSKLNSDMCYTFVNTNSCFDPDIHITTRDLKISLPFEDCLATIYLDTLIPRVLELALHCSNRKIRMTSCELLHSLVIVFLGTCRKMDVSRQSELDPILDSLVRTLLRLSCDLDEPIQKLFEPLVLSLVRWYTHPLKSQSSQTQLVIEALMDGITQSHEPAVRDFCGRCIKELTVWTIKQIDIGKDFANVKVLVQRIMSYSLHCDYNKKLGAALIFNNIYAIIREEDTIFNLFWIEILYAFVMSLETMEPSNRDSCCFEQINQALTHVQRGLVEKASRFNEIDSDRRIPPHFEGNSLKDVATFVLKHTASKNQYCRAKCMELFCAIRPLIVNCNDCKREGCSHIPDWIQSHYELKSTEQTSYSTTQDLFEWLHNVFKSLDGYLFLVRNGFAEKQIFVSATKFLSALNYFVNYVAVTDLKKLVSFFTVTEKEDFNNLKACVALKIIDFVIVVLKAEGYSQHIPHEFWKSFLSSLACSVIFDVQHLSIEAVYVEEFHKNVVLNLLDTIKDKLPANIVTHIETSVSSYIIGKQLSPTGFSRCVPLRQRLLIKGILILQESKISININLPNIAEQIFEAVFGKSDAQICVTNTFDDTFRSYYDTLLQLAFFKEHELRKLIECIHNNATVNVMDSSEITTCGRYFFKIFKNTVISRLIDTFPMFLSVSFEQNNLQVTTDYLKEFLDYIQENRSVIKKEVIKSICEQILENWHKLVPFFNKTFSGLQHGLDFLKKVAIVVPFPVFWIGKPEYGIGKWIIETFKREDLQLPFEILFSLRIQICEIFPCVSGMFDEENVDLTEALKLLQALYYNQYSELKKVSVELSMKTLLDVLQISRSRIILEGIAEIYATTPYNINTMDLENALSTYMEQIDSNLQLKSVESLYKLSLSNNSLPHYKMANDIFMCLLQNCRSTAFVNFIKNHIKDMLHNLGDLTSNIIQKILAYIAIEVLFFKIDFVKCDSVCSEIIQIGLQTEQSDAREFIRLIARYATDATEEKVRGCLELFRLYQCKSYNALASVISNTKEEIKFYSLLFTREAVWNNIVDQHKKYIFKPTFDNSIPVYKNRSITIRREIRALKRSKGISSASVNYSESPSLFTSTLSEDVSKFDFTNTVLRNEEMTIAEEQHEIAQQGVALETIEINDHECMATICGLIEYITYSGISTLPDVTSSVTALPDWMKGIWIVLNANVSHLNAKLLLVKVIHNTSHIFKPYSKWFLPVIIKLICAGCIGNEINYLVYDLVDMLLEWSETPLPLQENDVYSNLLTFLMNNVDNDIPAIYKMNRELIRTVIEMWKSYLKIPHQLLFDRLKLPLDSKKLASGVDLIYAVLLNKLEAWDKSNTKEFLIALCKVFIAHQSRSIYQEASKCIGLALKLLESKADSGGYLTKLIGLVNNKMKALSSKDKFLYCLEGIVSYYPQIADGYLSKLITELNTIQGVFKAITLKVILARSLQLKNISEFALMEYEALLQDVDLDVQILTLEIVRNYLPNYNAAELFRVLQIVVRFLNNTNISCRVIIYDILMKTLDTCSCDAEIQSFCKDKLVEGITDENVNIQEKIITYLSTQDLPRKPEERSLMLLNDYYKPTKEQDFIGYTIYFLLDVLKDTEMYKSPLFDEPLHRCTFEEYKLYGHWRAQHASIVPMFANTLRSQTQQESLHSADLNILRATQQSLAFKPTQIEQDASTSEQEKFKNPNQLQLSHKYKYGRNKYRFYKDKDRVSRHYALQEVKNANTREQMRRDIAKQKEKGVTFYRQYKKGDFPDIQIEHKDVLLPLQILAKHDSEIASLLFNIIVESIIEKLKDSSGLVENIVIAINRIFNISVQFQPSLIRTFLNFALEHKETVKFDPEVIYTVCQSSGLISNGIMILEDYLISSSDADEPSIKRSRSDGLENECWIYLSELYKNMDEFDAVNSILLNKLQCPEEHLIAIKAEADHNWKDALEAYEELINKDSESFYRKELYYESYFKCFASLSDWENLSKNIEASVHNAESNVWKNLWDQDWNQKTLLPWYLKSELKRVLIGSVHQNRLMQNINECFKDFEKNEYLRTNFPEELAVLWLLNGNEDEAKINLQTKLSQFLEKWANLNNLFTKSRFIKLLNIRNVVDVDIFVKKLLDISPVNLTETTTDVIKMFLANSENLVTDLQIFETRILYQKHFATLLEEKLKGVIHYDIELEEILGPLNTATHELTNHLIEAALKHNNFYMAREYLKQQPIKSESFKYNLMRSKIGFLKAKLCDLDTKAEFLMECWNLIDPLLSSESEAELKILAHQHLFEVTKQLAISSPNLNEIRKKTNQNLTSDNDIAIFGMAKLRNTADIFYSNLEQIDHKQMICKHLAKAYVEIAYFAHQNKGLDDAFLISVLRSMKMGSMKGAQLFPCILNVPNLGTTLKTLFLNEMKTIAIWMLLRWIPQLLMTVTVDKVTAVSDIIEKIAVTYPQAIMYTYKLSKDSEMLKNESGNIEIDMLKKRLDELLLSDNIVYLFLKALTSVNIPANTLRHHLKVLSEAVHDSQQEFNMKIDGIIEELYYEKPDSRDVSKFQGNAFKSILVFKNDLEALKREKNFEPRSRIIVHMDKKLVELIKDHKKFSPNLKDYCPWLANFCSLENTTSLEIPGQYTGMKMPLPQYHVKIAGFARKVSIMTSQRRPIRLVFLGNDAKEYSYLIKYGEDLRQDQRIEQLFWLMNDVLKSECDSSIQHLSIRTYQVIPLTNKLGMIEWVDNAESFQKLIEKALSKRKLIGSFEKAIIGYQNFLKKQNKRSKKPYSGLLKCPRDEVVANYQALVNHFPEDLLRSTLRHLSSGPESFIALKINFIKSYAAMCIAHWLLGIGDRHLENSLLSLKDGKIVGIDFGHAFGTATQRLPVPELVPFRLTAFITNLLEPLGKQGLFRETMVKILKAFRKNCEALLATMEVFVKEPSLEWITYSGRFEALHGCSKVSQARKKLEGVNPVEPFIQDLQVNCNLRENKDSYISLVKGDVKEDIRARKGHVVSIEEQIDCLLDLATDRNVLGRMYEGYCPWI